MRKPIIIINRRYAQTFSIQINITGRLLNKIILSECGRQATTTVPVHSVIVPKLDRSKDID